MKPRSTRSILAGIMIILTGCVLMIGLLRREIAGRPGTVTVSFESTTVDPSGMQFASFVVENGTRTPIQLANPTPEPWNTMAWGSEWPSGGLWFTDVPAKGNVSLAIPYPESTEPWRLRLAYCCAPTVADRFRSALACVLGRLRLPVAVKVRPLLLEIVRSDWIEPAPTREPQNPADGHDVAQTL